MKNTNLDAIECKRSAIECGYIEDEFAKFFVKSFTRKEPLINKGIQKSWFL